MQTRWPHRRSIVRPAALAAAALTVAASVAGAQYSARRPGSYGSGPRATEVYEWRGQVDREVRLQLRGNRASLDRVGTNDGRRSSGRVLHRLPRVDGVLRIERVEGRGEVRVIQQPSARNNYTAVLRLRDPSSGAGYYHVVAYWHPTRDGYARGRRSDDRWDDRRRAAERDRRRDRDDRDDRKRPRDRDTDRRGQWERANP